MDHLQTLIDQASRIFLDTAPIIYFVENHPHYRDIVQTIIKSVDDQSILLITSPITLAECLVIPLRNANTVLHDAFYQTIVFGNNTHFVMLDESHARLASQLRATYNLTLTDAFQIAVAILAQCDFFVTNDKKLQRVSEISVLVLDDWVTPSV